MRVEMDAPARPATPARPAATPSDGDSPFVGLLAVGLTSPAQGGAREPAGGTPPGGAAGALPSPDAPGRPRLGGAPAASGRGLTGPAMAKLALSAAGFGVAMGSGAPAPEVAGAAAAAAFDGAAGQPDLGGGPGADGSALARLLGLMAHGPAAPGAAGSIAGKPTGSASGEVIGPEGRPPCPGQQAAAGVASLAAAAGFVGPDLPGLPADTAAVAEGESCPSGAAGAAVPRAIEAGSIADLAPGIRLLGVQVLAASQAPGGEPALPTAAAVPTAPRGEAAHGQVPAAAPPAPSLPRWLGRALAGLAPEQAAPPAGAGTGTTMPAGDGQASGAVPTPADAAAGARQAAQTIAALRGPGASPDSQTGSAPAGAATPTAGPSIGGALAATAATAPSADPGAGASSAGAESHAPPKPRPTEAVPSAGSLFRPGPVGPSGQGPAAATAASAPPSTALPATGVAWSGELAAPAASASGGGTATVLPGETAALTGVGAPSGEAQLGMSAAPEAVRQQVAEQLIRQDTLALDKGRVVIRLNPPQLGRVEVVLERQGDRLTVVFRPETADVERALRGGAGDLAGALAARGARWSDVQVRVEGRQEHEGGGSERRDGEKEDGAGDQRGRRQRWGEN